MEKFWQTSKRMINCFEKTLVMAILNVTPDSFSDGGEFYSVENALTQAEKLLEDGADILDIGGESTRPNSKRISVDEELARTIPVIEAISKRFDTPISVDTTKSEVAQKAIESGAEIINDISSLSFDEQIGEIVSKYKAGLILMNSRGSFKEMHRQKPVENILTEVSESFRQSIEKAENAGVKNNQICLDVGIGFSKTLEQNLELIAKMDEICGEFSEFPMLIGTSRKLFIGKILGDVSVFERSNGTLATNVLACWNGANIVRVHDVKETVEALKIVDAIKEKL